MNRQSHLLILVVFMRAKMLFGLKSVTYSGSRIFSNGLKNNQKSLALSD